MKVIQIRNVPDELHAELRRRAAEAGVTLSDYVLDELRRVGGRSRNAEVLVRAALRQTDVTIPDITAAVRNGRDAR